MILYKAEYTGLLKVTQEGDVYTFIIGIPSYMVPTTMTFECESDEEFIDYIKEELRTRNYMRLDIYKVIRTSDSREE